MPEAFHTGSHDVLLGYHAMLLSDAHRMDCYERMVRRLVTPEMVVLDLGAGTGIWGLLAARLGARVHLVESGAVAGLAAQLATHNGLADRVTVHHGDFCELPVAEPVDLVISEFMGRFVVDDGMLGAVAAARRWMKPDAVFAPGELRLRVAPVAMQIPQIAAFARPVYGLDLGPAAAYLHNTAYAAALPPAALLAPAQTYATLRPPEVLGALNATLSWTVADDGVLGALAGWFEADLCDDVLLSTAPGSETHWQQYVFPVPRVAVKQGDLLTVHLRLEDRATKPNWRWTGELRRDGTLVASFDQEVLQRLGQRPSPPQPAPAGDLAHVLADANAASASGDLHAAAAAWELAGRTAPPNHPASCAIFENIGLARMQRGDPQAAVRAFLRALDGDLSSRKLSLRWLVVCLANAGLHQRAAVALAAYEQHFGRHPDASPG